MPEQTPRGPGLLVGLLAFLAPVIFVVTMAAGSVSVRRWVRSAAETPLVYPRSGDGRTEAGRIGHDARGSRFVWIPTDTGGLWMGATEVSRWEYASSQDEAGLLPWEWNLPQVRVSAREAAAYAAFQTGLERRRPGGLPDGWSYRLPTDEEWEAACRADGVPVPDLDVVAWHAASEGQGLQWVGGKEPNAWGLHDMLGNAFELCLSPGPGGAVAAARRGGGISMDLAELTPDWRQPLGQDEVDSLTGFRVVIAPDP